MSHLTASRDTLQLDTPSFTFRHFKGDEDFPHLLTVIQQSKAADQIEDADTLEGLTNFYSHLTNCDLQQDLIMAEADGQVVGYGRVMWLDEGATQDRLYIHIAFIRPQWRGRGLGQGLMDWM